MGTIVRILRVVLMITVPLFALLVALSWINYDFMVDTLGPAYFIRVADVLIATVLLSSGVLLLREWRNNPVEETERGEWTSSQLIYSIVFAIILFVSAYFLPALFFSF